ncbi:MAG: hypothetical protein KME10_11415 [Plectolyngbya sp. WJT66-NPBG17]|nr:hypothetical protein [Plectolyngbya sp. WJT66-NPBG17]
MYTQIKEYRCNQNSYGQILEKDKAEILALLNSSKYTPRETVSEDYETDRAGIINELEKEAYELYPSEEPRDQQGRLSYPHNCHSLARKMKERRQGWEIVRGYAIEQSSLGSVSIQLISHSVIKNELGMLVELTPFGPESSVFIEHTTGKFGIDLIAS